MKEETQKHLLAQIQENFKTFGAGQEVDPINKTALALEDGPLCFAAGVDVADVVALVLQQAQMIGRGTRPPDRYQEGFEAGVREYAWWADGVQYVGSCGTTLKKALEDLSTEDPTG